MPSDTKPSHKILMTRLLESGRHSDFTIVCGERHFPVHHAIVSERCDLIRAAMSRPMKEHAEKTFTLPKADPEAVHGALFYLYTLCYPKDIKDKIGRELRSHPDVTSDYWARLAKYYWVYDLELFKVAHYLGLEPLAKMAKEELDKRCAHPSPELFLSRTLGYALLVEQLYHKPTANSYDESEIYVDLLKDTRKLLLASTSKLVAENIKNERLNRLTEEISEFKQDVFSELAEQNRRAALALPWIAAAPALNTNGGSCTSSSGSW